MFQLMVVFVFTYLIATGLCRLVFRRGLWTLLNQTAGDEKAPGGPVDELVRRRSEAAARAAAEARRVRRVADVTETLARREAELAAARERLRQAQEARVTRVVEHEA